MKIVAVETFAADGGYRTCRYVKVTTDAGLVGWSEYSDHLAGASIAGLIAQFGRRLIALEIDPSRAGVVGSLLGVAIRPAAGGAAQQAIAAIENACLDIQGKAAGMPVSALYGGPFRTQIPVYWSHFGSFRARFADFYEQTLGKTAFRSPDDFTALAQEARELGITAVKTNPISFRGDRPELFNAGYNIGPGALERTLDRHVIDDIRTQVEAIRDAFESDVDVMLDVGFSQRADGYCRLVRELADLQLRWLELDSLDAKTVAEVHDMGLIPIASGESLHGLAQYGGFLSLRPVDVVVVDVMWNGFWQALRVAAVADAQDTNVAAHNHVGQLGSAMAAHLHAAIPNTERLEFRVDEAPWTLEFVDHPLEVLDGMLQVPSGPGWGMEIDESALAAHPSRY